MKKLLLFFASLCFISFSQAQDRRDKVPVTYEELYDEPYSISKLFVHFQPIYGELWKANVNAGFGLEATYIWQDKMTFRAHARKSYTRKFDLSRDLAERNNDMENEANIFNLYEFGATYHLKDYDKSSTTKMVLYKKSYKDGKWAARVPLNAEVPCTLRKIVGIRLGGIFYDTSVDLKSALEDQGGNVTDFVNAEGNPLPATLPDEFGDPRDIFVYGNMAGAGVYVGSSITWIRNVAVDFDNNYQEGVDDLILTAFFDFIITPKLTVDDVFFQGEAYASDVVETSKVGFRLGLEGKFNRTLSWAYGGEIGMRPGLKKRGFYAAIKVSFPVFSTNLDYSVEAFGK
ncbi:hypothetical protein [Fulvivirga sedimenti]|uniref:DUF4421 domain-containing protein n=1 Tax=Fulvivirga sedimenti TaxID=2879465 RepID=A0A9X1HW97_9BACT|nr:hypothetical protein [Fulvivirga sedimenti]MCA6075349.1 hypothetical protein [Fulvivirga sedimenti]MCA6076526.1 hypothetical protein [Fulvivirga sedimenti]MCA6077654.1 hypothetical protein [Fulvivirga sedimenti]